MVQAPNSSSRSTIVAQGYAFVKMAELPMLLRTNLRVLLGCLSFFASGYAQQQPCLYPSIWQSQLQAIMIPSDLAAFQTSITPFANLTTATYTGNAIAIPNYNEVARHEAQVGLHWIAMLHTDQQRLILGFRGTVSRLPPEARCTQADASGTPSLFLRRTLIARACLDKRTIAPTGSYGILGLSDLHTAASSTLQP
jgi:hypothetical protein